MSWFNSPTLSVFIPNATLKIYNIQQCSLLNSASHVGAFQSLRHLTQADSELALLLLLLRLGLLTDQASTKDIDPAVGPL